MGLPLLRKRLPILEMAHWPSEQGSCCIGVPGVGVSGRPGLEAARQGSWGREWAGPPYQG